MNTLTITQKNKNKHIDSMQIEYILNSIKNFEKDHKGKRRNINKTAFIKFLADEVGTSVSNIYRIRKIGTVDVLSFTLKPYKDCSAIAVVNRFNDGRKRPNNMKLHKAHNFINKVVKMVKKKHTGGDNKYDLTSIDEAVNSLIIDYPELYPEDARVCTKTIYNYVNRCFIDIKRIDLPRISGLRGKSHINKHKLALEKRQKGVSIDSRPNVASRDEFGHWEGDF